MRDADPEPGSGPSSRSTALGSIEDKVIFKLYSLFERLATIEEFSFSPEEIRQWKEDEADAFVKQIDDEINGRIEARSEDGVVGRSELQPARPRIHVVNRTHFSKMSFLPNSCRGMIWRCDDVLIQAKRRTVFLINAPLYTFTSIQDS